MFPSKRCPSKWSTAAISIPVSSPACHALTASCVHWPRGCGTGSSRCILTFDVVTDVVTDVITDVIAPARKGSGFPLRDSLDLQGPQKQYSEHPWNLNNLPVLPGSVLQYIGGSITGITTPWMYIGMMFSSFCWCVAHCCSTLAATLFTLPSQMSLSLLPWRHPLLTTGDAACLLTAPQRQ